MKWAGSLEVLRVGSRWQSQIGCPGKDLMRRYLSSKDLREVRELVAQIPGGGAAGLPGSGSVRC